MFISEEGLVAGSVNRAELVAAYNSATDEAVRANLAACGAEHGLEVVDGKLVDPSEPEVEPEPEPEGDVGPYDGFTKAELQAELERRGLPTSGNKDELAARLIEDDEEEEPDGDNDVP